MWMNARRNTDLQGMYSTVSFGSGLPRPGSLTAWAQSRSDGLPCLMFNTRLHE